MPKGGPKIGRGFIRPTVEEAKLADAEVAQAKEFVQSLMERAAAPAEMDPEKVAEFLFDFLPDETKALIREAQDNRMVPLWQMLLGYVMNCSEQMTLFAPYVLAAWESGVRPNAPRPCKTCGLKFLSRHPGAAYCCNPCAMGKDRHTDDCPTMSVKVLV